MGNGVVKGPRPWVPFGQGRSVVEASARPQDASASRNGAESLPKRVRARRGGLTAIRK